MLFDKDEGLGVDPYKTKTLLISVGIHLLLVLVVVWNPDLLTSNPKRIIRINGQDYNLQQLTELVAPPESRPTPPPENRPLVQPPPQPEQPDVQPPQPPPPPQQQPPQPPPPVIGPDDVIADGARP